MNQISMFEFLDAEALLSSERQRLRFELRRGSGFENGKQRIIEHIHDKDFEKFLAKEYGIGGWSCKDGFFEHDSKGISIYDKHFTNKRTYSWTTVAKEILDMINTNSY